MTGPQVAQSATESEPKTFPARRSRRTRRAVATVQPSSAGNAACTGHQELFDAAENYKPPVDILIQAAAVCATCPIAATCGFRITAPATALRTRVSGRAT
ncbi:hypothetical protein OG949_41250 (plasmid) [Streptomyces scopuliridis]|uniref:hypothetical protein n=1 Tax=Streptomyces scopuliridis TaxID=452529 RepID=UPI002DD9F937|nr:hypothetical protein [Streptomyces scopuliridis]WSB39170.1 hypothetical protein OG949_41250 [Streptomyces scopuliridis]